MAGCNNPAPWVHPSNGTIYIVCGNEMKRAENISGPWSVVTTFSHVGGPAGAYEDPYLYTDQHGWHLLYHVYTTGGLQLSQSHELLVPQSSHACSRLWYCCVLVLRSQVKQRPAQTPQSLRMHSARTASSGSCTQSHHMGPTLKSWETQMGSWSQLVNGRSCSLTRLAT